MNVALKIQKQLDKKVDLKLIKNVIALYEKLKNQNDDELMSLQDAKDHLQDILGNVSITEKLKAYRNRKGFTQKDLANKADIKQQHVSEIERGLRPVGVATAKKLARALNCNYKSLL
jgi:DNA-binding XRE family transcriptional regulator